MRRFGIGNGSLLVLLALGVGLNAAIGLSLDASPRAGPALPPVLSGSALRLAALGDTQFAFRNRAFALQHAGNLGGQIVPYGQMDYHRLEAWLRRLDQLDSRSLLAPMMAAYLYSGSQNVADIAILVDYLSARAARDPAREWRWQVHAFYLARYRLEDNERALALANELSTWSAPTIPGWTRQLRIVVLRDLGRKDAARALARSLLETDLSLSEAERRLLHIYLDRELK